MPALSAHGGTQWGDEEGNLNALLWRHAISTGIGEHLRSEGGIRAKQHQVREEVSEFLMYAEKRRQP